VAGRITSTVRQEDTVARIGGDEFVVVLADVGGPQDVARVAQKLLESISRRLVLQGQELRLSASIGITLSGKGRHGPEDLLKQADLAMYRAKESGKGTFQFFTPALDELALERLNLERELRMALDQGQLVLHYQPRVDLRTMRIVGVEALARWQHPKRGLLPPEDFIPLAEETGLIRQLGEQVLHAATRQAGAWNRAGLGPLKVSVNLSVRQLHGSAIV